jgi:hypothetical protein
MATANQLGLNPRQYVGEREIRCTIQNRPPTINDKYNFRLNDFWIVDDPTNAVVADRLQLWVLLSLREGEADWFRFDISGGGVDANSFPTDNGTAVPTALGVLNVVGDGTYIDTDALVANTITINLTDGDEFLKQVDTDSGTATPANNILNIVGGDNINTAGATDTVTVNLNKSVRLPNSNVAGDEGVYYTGASGTPLAGGNRFLYQLGTRNVFLGEDSGNLAITTGTATDNTVIGFEAGNDITTAARSVFIGSGAGEKVTDANDNVFIGDNAGSTTTSSSNNILVGSSSGASLTTGDRNIFIGRNAGMSATSLNRSIFIGDSAGQNLTSTPPIGIIGIGTSALSTATGGGSGEGSTALGHQALSSTTDANLGNTALGRNALRLYTSGATEKYNTAVGHNAAQQWTSSTRNTFIGGRSGHLEDGGGGASTGSGSDNTCLGAWTLGPNAGGLTITSSNNILIGSRAGEAYASSESNNIIIATAASGVPVSPAGDNNVIRIGGGTGSSTYQQNKCFISGIRGITTANADAIAVLVDSANQLGTVSSSKKFKEDIKDMGDASSFIYKLQPRTFHFKGNPEGTVSPGLIAEEVEEVSPWLVAYDDKKEAHSVKYHELPTLLLNELQKLKKEVMELKDELSILRTRMKEKLNR